MNGGYLRTVQSLGGSTGSPPARGPIGPASPPRGSLGLIPYVPRLKLGMANKGPCCPRVCRRARARTRKRHALRVFVFQKGQVLGSCKVVSMAAIGADDTVPFVLPLEEGTEIDPRTQKALGCRQQRSERCFCGLR
jgi:hypothetical protein